MSTDFCRAYARGVSAIMTDWPRGSRRPFQHREPNLLAHFSNDNRDAAFKQNLTQDPGEIGRLPAQMAGAQDVVVSQQFGMP